MLFWKFNNNLLHDIDYVNLTKKTISENKTNLIHYSDKGLVWELIKLKIRSLSLAYCIKKKKNMNSFNNNFLKEINLLGIELDRNPPASNLERFNVSKIELEQIEKHETQGNILRTKIRWTEDGEKNSKLFLNLEKKNYCNKLITSLEVYGNLIKDHNNITKAQKHFYQNLY